jgi:hypothetical protein
MRYHTEFSSSPWDDHHQANDQLIFIDIESYARVRRSRPGDGGGTTPVAGTGTLATYVSGDAAVANSSEYNIEIIFQGSWTTSLQQAFIVSANAISKYIIGDVPDIFYYNRIIDDLSITASLVNIDGTGGILGQAGPNVLRQGLYQPVNGVMQFDSADAAYYNSIGLFDDIVLHEMLHTVGFGSVWNYRGLVSGAVYTGALANAVYPGTEWIPVENDGGSGTAGAHWEESVFGNELMTGYIDSDNSLSYMTIASLGDLGYNVISGASYVPPSFV